MTASDISRRLRRLGNRRDAQFLQRFFKTATGQYGHGDRFLGIRAPLDRLACSRLLWERRIAILATLHFIRRGEAADTLRIARCLLGDSEDLIHKATGWMLREAGKRCGAAPLETFLEKYAARMPRTMLRYALERLPAAKRKRCMSR